MADVYLGRAPHPRKLQFTLKVLKALIQEANEDGVQAVVFIIPSLHRHVYTKVLKEELRAAGVSVLDIRREMEARGLGQLYFSRDDSHWNAAGHALASEQLAKHIAETDVLADAIGAP
jgi:hypothetical protein